MRVVINGEERETAASGVAALIAELGLDPRKVAVERNLEIVPRSQHAATSLAEGDRIEIVQFVGGG
jgi:sulfur carrier protein